MAQGGDPDGCQVGCDDDDDNICEDAEIDALRQMGALQERCLPTWRYADIIISWLR